MSATATEPRTETGKAAEAPVSTADATSGADAATPAATTDAAKKGAQTRPYRVLVVEEAEEVSVDPDRKVYREVGVYEAAGDKQAIKAAMDAGVIEIGGKFVAVAESAWHEHEPKLKEAKPTLAW